MLPVSDIDKPDVAFLEQPMTNDRRWFSPPLYGLPNFSDLFTSRQLVMLTTLCEMVEEVRQRIRKDGSAASNLSSQFGFHLADLGMRCHLFRCFPEESVFVDQARNAFAPSTGPQRYESFSHVKLRCSPKSLSW